MKKSEIAAFVGRSLLDKYPDATCALRFKSPFECLCAVLLSAQCSDKKVNEVTPSLFESYPSPIEMSKAPIEDIENRIRSLGLYKNKALHLSNLSKILCLNYDGQVPSNYQELVTLPGVGNKTARVVLMEVFGQPSFPVDTHVGRVSSRLGLVKPSLSATAMEAELEKLYSKELQTKLHHCFILFGREICHSQNPDCKSCTFCEFCRYFPAKNTSFKTGK